MISFPSKQAFAYNVIQFYSDHRREEIKLPSPECDAFLDDDRNYTLSKSKNSLLVSTRALNEQSALLMLDCGQEMIIYSLHFKNAFKRTPLGQNHIQAPVRPESNISLSAAIGKKNAPSFSFRASDSSLKGHSLFLYEERSPLNGEEQQERGFDVFHRLPFHLGLNYGYSFKETQDYDQQTIRLGGSILGFFVNLIQHRREGNMHQQNLSVVSPAPLHLRYSLFSDASSYRAHKLVRGFALSWADFWSSLQVSLQLEEFDGHILRKPASHLSHLFNYRFDHDTAFRQTAEVRCEGTNSCLLEKISFEGSHLLGDHLVKANYSLIPHSLLAETQINFSSHQSLLISVYKAFQPLLMHDASAAFSHWSTNSLLRLQYAYDFVNFTASIPLFGHPSTGRPDIGMTLAKDFAKSSVFASAQLANIGADNTWSTSLNYRYYFENNLNYVRDLTQSHELTGTVVSNFENMPLKEINVKLYSDGKERASKLTDPEGRFHFENIPPSGTLTLKVSSGAFEAHSTVDKRPSEHKVTTRILFKDKALLYVRFFLDMDNDGEFSANDVLMSDMLNVVAAIGEPLVSHPDATYDENLIAVPLADTVSLDFTPELLPFEYEFIKIKNNPISYTGKETIYVDVLLARSK